MVDRSQQSTESTREGGREATESLTSGLSGSAATPRGRNSSGQASTAASLLDLRVKLNLAYELIERLFEALGDADAVVEVKRIRQQGFRVDRRPR